MTINELLTLLSSANSGVLIWLCFDRDRLNERINRAMGRIKALEYHAEVKEQHHDR